MHYNTYENNTVSPSTKDNIIDGLIDAWYPAYKEILSYDEAVNTVTHLINTESSEFFHKNIKTLHDKNTIVGATVALRMEEVTAARQVNIFNILSIINDKKNFMNNMISYNKLFPDFPKESGIYLSKFTVLKAYRNHGYGRILLEHFLENNVGNNDAFLEVHKQNKTAMKLYTEHAFEPICGCEKPYILMKRTQ